MDKVFTGPGKITIDLTPPKPPPPAYWKQALRFCLYALAIIAGLTILSQVVGVIAYFFG